MKKNLTEDNGWLNVQVLKRRGMIHIGKSFGPSGFVYVSDSPSGKNGATEFDCFFRVKIDRNHIVLKDPQASPTRSSMTVVELERTPCTFGGEREWFRCPQMDCGRRVGVLYRTNEIMCRKCARLKYQTQYLSRYDRSLRKCQSIRLELHGSANLLEDFPARPKGMRRARYLGLRARSARAEEFCREDMAKRFHL
jgi:hypothetical protein